MPQLRPDRWCEARGGRRLTGREAFEAGVGEAVGACRCGAGECQGDGAAAGRGEGPVSGRADECGAMGIGDDEAGLCGGEGGRIEKGRERFGHGPEEGVAMVEIVAPLAVTHEVGARRLDFGEPDCAAGVDADDVGAAAVGEADLANRGEAV